MRSRIRNLCLSALATVLAVVSLVAPGGAQDARPLGERSVAGRLLVASPSMPDPRFRRTVILMMAHSDKGAIGFVVNRVSVRRPIRDVLRALGRSTNDVAGEIAVHWGGPVSPNTAVVIHGAGYGGAASKPIPGGYRISGSPQILADIARGKGPTRYLFARGYAGWGPGQLDRELKTRAWIVIPAEPGLVFPKDVKTAWTRALKRRGTDL